MGLLALNRRRLLAQTVGRRVCLGSRNATLGNARRGCAASGPRLSDLWDKRLPPLGVTKAQLAVPSAQSFREHVKNAHHWRMVRMFGDPMSSSPPFAPYIFYSCGVIESLFLCVNVGTFSPFIFEMFMPYHLKYTGLVMCWWGGTYWGLNVARYGPIAGAQWSAARAVAGVFFMAAGFVGLVLADGVGKLGPWPSYWLLISTYSAMAGFDTVLHSQRFIPPWLLKWKLAVSGIIVASLLLGVVKGNYLERNAMQLILEAAG